MYVYTHMYLTYALKDLMFSPFFNNRENNTRYKLTNLRVSQSFTVMSYDPEISSNSLLGDQATEDTHP